MNNEFRILLEAYAQASNDGDTGTAEALMRELDGLAVSSQLENAFLSTAQKLQAKSS